MLYGGFTALTLWFLCSVYLSLLFQEYEHQKSPEAKFVKDMDKLEMLYQAYEYEEINKNPGHLQEFYDHTFGKFVVCMVQGIQLYF